MKLLIDTDAFCKLGIAGLLADAAHLFKASLSDCGRLAALPYMLQKGSLPRLYGHDACNALTAEAARMPVCPPPVPASLEPFALSDAIDPGEVQLFGAAMEFNLVLITGDKRAVRGLKPLSAVHRALAGRIAVLDGLLLALCRQLSADYVRPRVAPLCLQDETLEVCFSPGISDPEEALLSYYESLVADVHPFLLWDPGPRRSS